MSIEAALAKLTESVDANTAMLARLAEAGIATGEASAPEEKPEPKKAPARKSTTSSSKKNEPEVENNSGEEEAPKKAPAKKAPAKKAPAKKAAEVEVKGTATFDEVKAACAALMDDGDREERKTQMRAAFDHLGIKRLPEIEDDGVTLAKLAAYVAHWAAGEEVSFEDIDEKVAEAADAADEGGEDDDDDMLG